MVDETLDKIRRERDLYLRLLHLGRQTEIEGLLAEALALVVEIGEAQQGYLELYDGEDPAPRWWIAHGFSDEQVERVRGAISKGIIAEAVASGKTVSTPSARIDPRFQDFDSVRLKNIEAVLCAPVGGDPPKGVLYLQGRARPGLFTAEECERAETFAEHLAPLVDRLIERRRAAERSDPTQPLRKSLRLEGIVGRSATLAAVLKQVALVAPLDVSVLLTGDSGTGKSQLARVIHENGPRAAAPFVELNCAALPEQLVESELFGALPGAHSTATRRIEGKVAAAERGTLFLDEVGELSPGVQAKLLQLLQSKEYYPLGAAKPLHADVRVIAATNLDLERAVAEKRFREDLYYRLHVLPLRVPSLAERRDDVAVLAESFRAQASARHNLPSLPFSRGALRALEAAPWPGNIRQLLHAVEAGLIRAAGEGADQIEPVHVFPDRPPAVEVPAEDAPRTLQEGTRRYQAELVRQTLERNDWNILESSRQLDIARSHLYTLIRSFGFERERN